MRKEREIRPVPVIVTIAVIIVSIVGIGAMFIGGDAGENFENSVNRENTQMFQFSDLTIWGSEVVTGETVFIAVEAKNTAENRRTENLELKVGAQRKTETVTLDKGENRIVTFSVSREDVGNYNVSISDFSGDFEVKAPPEFEESDLKVIPSEVEPGEPVDISAVVKNVGGSEGSHTLELEVDNDLVETRSVTLGAGENETVSFTLARTTTKTYSVKIGKLSESFDVFIPAEFKLSNLSLSGSKNCEKPFQFSVDVTNIGGRRGFKEVTITATGPTEKSKSKEVGVSPGKTKTVSINFDLREGSYTVSADGLSMDIKI